MKHFLLSLLFVGGVFATQAQLVDASFETGSPSGAWTEASTNFGTPLCTVALCGNCGGGCVAYEGDWYAWFGGAGAVEEGLMTQAVTIPNGTNGTLSFWFVLPTAGDALAADVFEVRMDGEVIWTANATQAAQYASYTEVSVDISEYTDGAAHSLSLYGYQSTGTAVNFIVDAFDMVIDGNPATDVNNILNNEAAVVVYPNPANEVVNFQFGTAAKGVATVNVYNLAGALVAQQNFNEVNNTIQVLNTAAFEAGIYVAEILVNGERFQQRIAVQH
ncbi:MAG: hypothetical protein RL226_499 [Bacteroidota bacterium]|jgi:hypothetical protein